jgi:polyhydroxyalkanoate synthesis regulator phasin
MQDAWRAYMELALGLTEASRKKAMKVAKELLGKGGATAEQLPAMAEELIKTSAANREAITKLVRYELDRALAAVGLATSEEVAELTARIRGLERQLQEVKARSQAAAPQPAPSAPARAAAPTGTAAKAVKKTAAKKTAAKSAQADRTAAKRTVAKQTVAKQTAAKKTGSRRAGAA